MPAKLPPSGDRLSAYRAKRSAAATPEPFGGAAAPRPRIFVVQKHDATRLHYDFRLEMGGVLLSWAVPKGPSLDPAEKRLAMYVEDHPVEYADFEGVIPEGNYGAGPVIVWDRGMWTPVEDPIAGLQHGKLLFDLKGYKLGGRWQLVRTKKSGEREPSRQWLLIKKPDAWASRRELPDDSVLSGLSIAEMGAGPARSAALRGELERLGAPRRPLTTAGDLLMLAETRDHPFSDPAWLFELKYDGYRLLAGREDGRPVLRYRSGREVTPLYPELKLAVAALPFDSLVLDGELVVLDDQGRPDFQRLQSRAMVQRALDIERAAIELPATLFCFDLLACEGHDLRGLPLATRKELLRRVLPRVGPLRYVDHIAEHGIDFHREVGALGLEGIMAKRASSTYRAGRSAHWLKLPIDKVDDFVVVGFTAPEGARTGFGALHLAAYDGAELVYAGRVGSGFSEKLLTELGAALRGSRRARPACSGPLPAGRGHVWVEPERVCTVKYKTLTGEGMLRQPTLVRMRDDKPPAECRLRHGAPPPGETPAAGPAAVAAAVSPAPPAERERAIRFSNLGKIFWPEQGYTKGDLIEYYRAIGPFLLPYLRDRPLVMTRFPDGIGGKSFFQKDAPAWAPDWLRLERMWSEHAEREISYFVCDELEALLYVANMATIPLHVWSSRVATLARPDWCILDLDPKGAPFAHVVEVARAIRRLCDDLELPSFVKTSGSTGLHVLLPLGAQCTYEQSRNLGHLMARVIESELPAIATTARVMDARGGRVYLDFLQNGHGKLLVAPFSVRPITGAPVSTPLRWAEVTPKLDHQRFTIRTVPARVARWKADPLIGVLSARPDLGGALLRLGERLRR